MSRGGGNERDRLVQVTISLVYYWFIVRFTIGYEFLFIAFLLHVLLVQMSYLSISSSAIYSSTLSNLIYLLVYLKVGMNQWSVFCPLMFAIVIDVVPSEVRSGIPSELLYADDLVLTAPIMEQLGRRLAE